MHCGACSTYYMHSIPSILAARSREADLDALVARAVVNAT